MGYLLQQFVYGFGGVLRWLYFQILNFPLNDKFQKNINYYLDIDSDEKDNNGFTVRTKNGFTFLITIFILIIYIEKTNK
ncbi:Hypothetical protein KQS_06830 [Flavobacterium indicum GPTSA100-9 = DSM 17447]|jgi:hypothetical protein|uniref:Uncharacterized protein n=1 Tax=Flavobacterium indicum (strain DSM 17447 / CIP 109464 / GPTSA100-9) TaxID=1094466 RepID=H8XQM7_FLAIG|nr:hypothetical protein [Flavobacterium indicum]CCG53325.1 Hypothetical protein KQS_06830 [Flavobacterium indicum GPTSA100-9 = DSM 17447]